MNPVIYIFGHSLDVTDKDVLQELLLCPYARTHIIYHNKKALADKIANVVKIIGQDKLIEKSYSENPQIDFIEQKQENLLRKYQNQICSSICIKIDRNVIDEA